MLKIEGLKAAYGEIEVLHGIDVEVSEGEIVAVIGANSSGKSTMLTCISRLMPVTGGKITFCGTDITHMKPEEVVNLGLIQCPEGRQLFPRLTVRENLELGAFCKRARNDKEKTLEQVFTFLPRLKERENQYGGLLSGGEQQRVSFARAMANNPKIIIADEPTANVDPELTFEIMNLLMKFNKMGKTVIVITHERNIVDYFKKRVITINKGKIEEDTASRIGGTVNASL